jgi:nitrate reductase NapD
MNPMREELHITGLVVQATPKRLDAVGTAIAAIAGAQVHAASPQGKLVVTLEAATASEMLAKVSDIRRTEGVLSAGLVYEHVDTLEAMNEDIEDDHPPGLH